MKISIIVAFASAGIIFSVDGEDIAAPPEMWKAAFRHDGQLIWDQLRKDDGKVTAKEVIEWMYKNHLGHDDGDSQVDAAFCLIQLDDDPLQVLRNMMTEDKPERRAYAVRIAGVLGDSRFTTDVNRLVDDEAKLTHWFWDTVGDIAKEAARSLAEGGIAGSLRAEGRSVAAWVPPTKPKSEAGTGQPATSPESESGGGDKPQPEAEGRSR